MITKNIILIPKNRDYTRTMKVSPATYHFKSKFHYLVWYLKSRKIYWVLTSYKGAPLRHNMVLDLAKSYEYWDE